MLSRLFLQAKEMYDWKYTDVLFQMLFYLGSDSIYEWRSMYLSQGWAVINFFVSKKWFSWQEFQYIGLFDKKKLIANTSQRKKNIFTQK